jgi:hypothetical protein
MREMEPWHNSVRWEVVCAHQEYLAISLIVGSVLVGVGAQHFMQHDTQNSLAKNIHR